MGAPVPPPPPGIMSDPGPTKLKVPPPDPVVPVPVPVAITLNVPVVPANPPVPLVTVMVAGPLDGVPAKTWASRVIEPVMVAVSVPVGAPLVMVRVSGAEPERAALTKEKFELRVPVPIPDRVTGPVAEILPPELVPVPLTVRVVATVAPCAPAQRQETSATIRNGNAR